jgi:hypothetical protein
VTRPSLRRLRQVALLLLLSAGSVAGELTLQDLVQEGRLELTATLSPETGAVPGQKMTLTIEIATDRWFSGGTRLVLPEVPGVVILQTEQFASNASERRGEQNWVLQRWTLDVYAQRPGEFTLPPVTARLKINAGDAGDVEGALTSPPVTFSVELPPELAGLGQWVAAPDYSVSQSFDRSLEGLQAGDAFEREIVFAASDVMAMMLPTFSAQSLPGLAAYPAPPVLDNDNNRGQVRASRTERISYVVQAEGEYQLPAADFFWWDTSRARLQVLSLPATTITVGAGASASIDGQVSTVLPSPRQWLLAAGGLGLLAVLLWLAGKYLRRSPLSGLGTALAAVRGKIHALRKPALPERLNPGNSAGE